jgi:release factor glutamine methyltransferase
MTELLKYMDERLPSYTERERLTLARIIVGTVCPDLRDTPLPEKRRRLSEEEWNAVVAMTDRLATGEPVQYVTGETEFYRMRFVVNPSVLIPRPETEELVDVIVRRERGIALRILDIGTGSGCIAVSLARSLAEAEVKAMDISQTALDTANVNARRNGVGIEFVLADILSDDARATVAGVFDVIVSNPPYVMRSEAADMETNVLSFEPHSALFVPDDDPLVFYRAICRFAEAKLIDGGRLYLEINAALADDTAALLRNNGYRETEIITDLSGKRRMIRAIK